jgi:alkyl sulfatase BDS1-like metallo-beta-lactamase superfamily hydrolase
LLGRKGTEMSRYRTSVLTISLIAVACFCGCADTIPPQAPVVGVNPDLAAHTAEFKQEVIKVTDGVYVAIGFGLANAVLIEGEDGVIIVDTMESAEAAAPVKAAFDSITSKPVKAIIYTHFHSDHTFGARVMAGKDAPDVYSHESTLHWLNRMAGITRETTYTRAMRQFGTLLPEGGVINAGIGPRLVFDQTKTPALMLPNRTFSGERIELEIAGVKLMLVHAPGETPDQIFVWLPERKVLLPADNFYRSFPNLYAIRGTTYRDVTQWMSSLDEMRAVRSDYLVPHHTRPLTGAETIYKTLTNYRDAIQFVHDQTIRYMNKGLAPEDIVERVKLPPHLSREPYLHEYYGTVPWSVRAIFDGYLGWFSGNATDLFPLGPRERAKRFARLAGGEKALLQHARETLAGKDYQWSLELTDHLLHLDPNLMEAREIKAAALTALGEVQSAATARNYYLTQALEVQRKLTIKMPSAMDKATLHLIPLSAIFQAMAVKLDPDKSTDVDRVVGFRFPDTGEVYLVHVRRGVAEIQPQFPENPDNTVIANSLVWKEIAAGLRSPAVALLKGELKIEGSILRLVQFLALFREDEPPKRNTVQISEPEQ